MKMGEKQLSREKSGKTNSRGNLSAEEISEMSIGTLISSISRAHLRYLFTEIEKHGITGGQYQFLLGLSKQDGITQEELASNFHMNQSTIARALKKLEDAGMVLRKTDDTNRRKNIITVTDNGRRVTSKIQLTDEKWEENVHSLSKTEKSTFKKMLMKVLQESLGPE
jgi:DNA-binding MarR family transcriptional regulator